MLTALALLILAQPPAPQQTALFTGAPGGAGDVLTVDVSGVGPATPVAALQGVELLPLDASGRSRFTEFLPDQPRVRDDVAGASRVLLPNDQGSIYRFRRSEDAGATYGWFAVAADGATTVLLERAGTGAAGDVDPFLATIGVSPKGSALLVLTTPDAGGDALEIDLASGSVTDRTASLPPYTFLPAGGRLLSSWGVAIAQEGIVRFDRAPAMDGALVPIDGIAAPTWWDGGIAVSADGSAAATVAGSAANAAHVIHFAQAGNARAIDTTPADIHGADFLPASQSGPHLALSADGALAAWTTRVTTGPTTTREAWIGRVMPTPGLLPTHLTADAQFVDTLDETGLIGFLDHVTLLLGVGEVADPLDPLSTDIDGMDLYTATWTGSAATVVNTSLTSQDAIQPFTKGELKTEDGLHLLANGRVLARDNQAEELGLVTPGSPGFAVVLDQVKELIDVEIAGPRLLVRIEHDTALVEQEIHALDPATATTTLLGRLPGTATVDRVATRPDGTVAFVVAAPSGQWLARADLVALTGGLATGVPLVFGPAIGLSPAGDVVVTLGAPAAPGLAGTWLASGAAALLPVASTPMQVLPGGS